MPNVNEQFLNTLSELFMQNDLAGVAEHFTFPTPFYTDTDLVVFNTASDLVQRLEIYRDAVSSGNVIQIIPRIVAEGIPVRGYTNLWVEWDHLRGSCKPVLTSQARYILFNGTSTAFPKVELIEYKISSLSKFQKKTPKIKRG